MLPRIVDRQAGLTIPKLPRRSKGGLVGTGESRIPNTAPLLKAPGLTPNRKYKWNNCENRDVFSAREITCEGADKETNGYTQRAGLGSDSSRSCQL